MTKCIICERRPARVKGFCAPCRDKIAAQENGKVKPLHFLTYREHVVGLYPNGGGALKPRLLRRSSGNLPKRNTLDLNHYCEGFSREKIKAFKACVLQLAHA